MQNAGQDAPFRLYYVFLPGCPACRLTKPAVRAWVADHPWVKLVPFNFATQEWRADGWHPTIVPTLIILAPDGRWFYREGPTTREELDLWLAKCWGGAALHQPKARDAVIDGKHT